MGGGGGFHCIFFSRSGRIFERDPYKPIMLAFLEVLLSEAKHYAGLLLAY